jgi:thiamine pyrophosphate-dependent acetolactate synthase large subunit-like protein
MKRAALAQLVKERIAADDIVVCGLGSTEAAYKSIGAKGLTYFASDPMGIWPSLALGLALSRPERRVVLLAGDGDLVMNLEVLVTIASVTPSNFRIVVFQNGSYASSGGQRLGGADHLSFAAIARGAGFCHAVEVKTEEDVCAELDLLFGRPELALVAVHLEDEPSPAEPPGAWSQVEERTLFMRRLFGN